MAKYEDEILAALHQNNLVMQQMVAQQTTPKSDVSGLKAFIKVAVDNPKTTIAGLGIFVCEIIKVFIPEMHEKLELTKAGLESYLGYKAMDASVKPKAPIKEEEVVAG